MKAKDNIFTGELNGVNGVFQCKKTKKDHKGNKRLILSSNGTRRDRKKKPTPKLLIRFGDVLSVQTVLGYQDRSQRMAQVLLPGGELVS